MRVAVENSFIEDIAGEVEGAGEFEEKVIVQPLLPSVRPSGRSLLHVHRGRYE